MDKNMHKNRKGINVKSCSHSIKDKQSAWNSVALLRQYIFLKNKLFQIINSSFDSLFKFTSSIIKILSLNYEKALR